MRNAGAQGSLELYAVVLELLGTERIDRSWVSSAYQAALPATEKDGRREARAQATPWYSRACVVASAPRTRLAFPRCLREPNTSCLTALVAAAPETRWPRRQQVRLASQGGKLIH